jgi:hypothetical protein
MSLVLTGQIATASTGPVAPNYLVATDADAADVRLGDRVVLTNSGGTYKEATSFTVYDKVSAFGFTNIYYSPNSAALTVAGDIMKVVTDDWIDYTNPLSLTVRLVAGSRTDIHIEQQIRDLSFRSTIPGGFASATFSLDRPLSTSPDELALFTRVYIYDGRHGGVVWEGQLEDPGRGAGEQGEIWELTAIGPSAHVRDRFAPYIMVDTSLERWHRSRYSTSLGQTQVGELNDGVTGADESQALMAFASEGATITTAWTCDWIYRSLHYCGHLVARIRADVIGDGTSSNYKSGIWARAGNGVALYSQLQNWSTVNQVLAANLGSVGWDDSADVVSFRTQRDVSATTADAFTTVYFYNIAVRSVVKNADGTDNLSLVGYNVNNIDPVEVVADLLGRFLTRYDGTNAVLVGSGIDIDQLAYPDGVTPGDVLDDLAVWDPAFYWAAWESNAAGKHRFEYVPWSTTVRYEATTVDGFTSPGSAADLYNRVHVRWRDSTGRIRNTIRTQTVPELSAAVPPIVRQFWIDLSDETGSATNAIYVGDNFLAEHRYPPNAGTLTVQRPILDTFTGRMVMPWEILPGHLIRVGGVVPRIDSLNPTNRDGVTVFKIVSTEYTASSASATLELDSFSRTVARALANLKTRRFRKR